MDGAEWKCDLDGCDLIYKTPIYVDFKSWSSENRQNWLDSWHHKFAGAHRIDVHDIALNAQMTLVAKVTKPRTENEYWIVNRHGELPRLRNRDITRWINMETWYPGQNWFYIVRNSNGYTLPRRSPRITFEEMYGYVKKLAMKEEGKGYTVTYGADLDVDSIELPTASIETYMQQLADKVRTHNENTDGLIELAAEMDKVLIASELVRQARSDLQERLYK